MTNRRNFIFSAAGSFVVGLLARPPSAGAQTATKLRRIGVLSPDPEATDTEFQEGVAPLRKFGWIEGKNLVWERRFANGSVDLLRRYAEELVRLKVDLIATYGTEAAFAAKNATTSIPIVMVSVSDPVAVGAGREPCPPGGKHHRVLDLGPGDRDQASGAAPRDAADGTACRRDDRSE